MIGPHQDVLPRPHAEPKHAREHTRLGSKLPENSGAIVSLPRRTCGRVVSGFYGEEEGKKGGRGEEGRKREGIRENKGVSREEDGGSVEYRKMR